MAGYYSLTFLFLYVSGGQTQSPTARSRKTTRHIHISNFMTNITPNKPSATQRPPDFDNSKYGKTAAI